MADPRTILFMHDDGYGVQTLIGADDKCGGFQGYRPYWQSEGWPDYCGIDHRFWTVWDRENSGCGPTIWPAVVDDFGNLRSGRMVRAIAQERRTAGVAAAPAPSEREQFEEALRRKPDALGWNLTDAMFWAWCAARNAGVEGRTP